MEELPVEILVKIGSYLFLNDISRVTQVCRVLHAVFPTPSILKYLGPEDYCKVTIAADDLTLFIRWQLYLPLNYAHLVTRYNPKQIKKHLKLHKLIGPDTLSSNELTPTSLFSSEKTSKFYYTIACKGQGRSTLLLIYKQLFFSESIEAGSIQQLLENLSNLNTNIQYKFKMITNRHHNVVTFCIDDVTEDVNLELFERRQRYLTFSSKITNLMQWNDLLDLEPSQLYQMHQNYLRELARSGSWLSSNGLPTSSNYIDETTTPPTSASSTSTSSTFTPSASSTTPLYEVRGRVYTGYVRNYMDGHNYYFNTERDIAAMLDHFRSQSVYWLFTRNLNQLMTLDPKLQDKKTIDGQGLPLPVYIATANTVIDSSHGKLELLTKVLDRHLTHKQKNLKYLSIDHRVTDWLFSPAAANKYLTRMAAASKYIFFWYGPKYCPLSVLITYVHQGRDSDRLKKELIGNYISNKLGSLVLTVLLCRLLSLTEAATYLNKMCSEWLNMVD